MSDTEAREAVEILASITAELSGKEIWECAISDLFGSNFDLQIGRRLPAEHPPALYAFYESRYSGRLKPSEHRGEYVLFVECAWRLQTDQGVICTWLDDRTRERDLELVVGKRIIAAEIRSPAWDISLRIERGLTLVVFCDRSDSSEDPDCYSLFSPKDSVAVTGKGVKLA